MEELLSEIYNFLMNILTNGAFYGPLLACFLIFIESIIPALPLFVFITILFISYGYFWGFLLSYILTCLGCIFSFLLCRKFFSNSIDILCKKHKNLEYITKRIENINLKHLVILVAMPFTPAFLINLAGGLSKMNFKKYLVSILIGKISLVTFWGFIGTSLVESLKNPRIMLVIILMLLISYIISKLVANIIKFE